MHGRMDRRSRGEFQFPGWAWALLWLAPAIAAVLAEPTFATQDGPAHVYNARIVAGALAGGEEAPWSSSFEVSAAPVPNWGGIAALLALGTVFPVGWHERALACLTLVGPALGVMALSRGRPGAPWRGLLAALLGLNFCWLLGFSGFLLGVAIGLFTVAFAMGPGGKVGPARAAGVAAAIIAGYFCHLVSLGLTVIALASRLALAPGPDRRARWAWGLAGLAPLPLLGLVYLSLMRSGGELAPESSLWGHWLQPGAWVDQAGWADPFSLASKGAAPLRGLMAPVLWLGLGLLLLLPTIRRDFRASAGFLAASALFLATAMLGPDTLGPAHGHYLPQRFALFGLMLLVPGLAIPALGWKKGGGWEIWIGRAALGALLVAWAGQSISVWCYAALCRERVGGLYAAGDAIPPGSRVATYLAETGSAFRANPLWHADCTVGARGRHVIWANYETLYYYFPVHFRPGLDRPPAREFEELAKLDGPSQREERVRRWEGLLEGHAGEIDAVLVWDGGGDAEGVLAKAGWERIPSSDFGVASAWRVGFLDSKEDASLSAVMEAGAAPSRGGVTGAFRDDAHESIGAGHRCGAGVGGGGRGRRPGG